MIQRTILKPTTLTTSCGRFLKNIERSYQSIIKGMELKEVVQRLNNYAPLSLAESWDNVGLLVEPSSPTHTVNSILLTNDLTEAVMDEAIQTNTNMILSYHPPIFAPLKTLTRSTWKERIVLKAIENRIAIYSPHTAFDVVKGGVNDWLATGLGKGAVRPLKNMLADGNLGTHKVHIVVPKDQKKVDELATKLKQADESIDVHCEEYLHDVVVNFKCNSGSLLNIMKLMNSESSEILKRTDIFSLAKIPVQDTGIGRLCTLEEAVSVETMIKRIKGHLELDKVRFAQAKQGSQNDVVSTIAICAGSGSSVLKGVKADMYLTGEMSHHDVLDAVSRGIHVVLAEHSNTERGFLKKEFCSVLSVMLDEKVAIKQSTTDADPIAIV